MKTAKTCIAFLLIAVFANTAHGQDNDGFESISKEIQKKLRITEGEPFSTETQQEEIIAVPESITKGKSLQLTGISSLCATRKKKTKLKEATMLFWLYVPPGLAKNFDDDENEFLAIAFGEKTKQYRQRSFSQNAFGITVKAVADADGHCTYPTQFISAKSLKQLIHTPPQIQGWNLIALGAIDNCTVVYINGVACFAEVLTKNAAIKKLMPVTIKSLNINNGLSKFPKSNIDGLALQDLLLIDKLLSREQVRAYCRDGSLPSNAKKVWEIKFNKGKPSAKSTKFKKSGNVKFKAVRE